MGLAVFRLASTEEDFLAGVISVVCNYDCS